MGLTTPKADIQPGKRTPARDYPRVIEGAIMQYKAIESGTISIDGRVVTGLAAVFGNVDDGNDRIHPGAFAKTINERAGRIRFLWQHNTAEPPTAVVKGLREVSREELPADMLRKHPEATGALQVTREYLETPRGNEVLAGIKAGAIAEMSFGYDVPKGKADFETVDGKSIRNLREVRLWEMCDVLWGMNPATRAAKGYESALASLEQLAGLYDMLKMLEVGQELPSDDVAAVRRVVSLLGAMLNSEPKAAEEPEAVETASRPVDPPPSLDAGMLARLAIAEKELQMYTGRAK
jgi:HK97 family phage prohead protease